MIKIVFLLLIILFSNSLFSKNINNLCNFDTSNNISSINKIENLKGLEIKVNNYKKWVKNSLLILTQYNKSIKKISKKKFKGELIASYVFGDCKYPIEIRQHGDQSDHLYFTEGGTLNQSVDVSMLKGSILGRTKFKLFTLKSRSEDEIFLTSILSELGYLSPLTFLTKVKLNNSDSTMLFQEKATKELLEHNKRVEGAIFEGDERFIWTDFGHKPFELEKISLSRMVNEKTILKNPNKSRVALLALNLLQQVFLKYSENCFRCNKKQGSIFMDFELLSNNSSELFQKWEEYELLLISSNAIHGLRPSNRKFFWNMYEMGFEPIYYDGSPKLDNKELKLNYLKGDEGYYLNLISKKAYDNLINKIKNLDSEILYNKIYTKGLKINFDQFQKKLGNLIININKLKSYLSSFSKKQNDTKYEYLNSFLKRAETTNIDFDFYKILNENKNILLKKCEKRKLVCEKSVYLKNNISKILSGIKLDGKNESIVLPSYTLTSNNNLIKKIFKNNKIKILSSDKLLVNFYEKENILKIKLNNINDFVIIRDSDLSNINIEFEGVKHNESEFSKSQKKIINRLGFTGCLTIYSSLFDNTNIIANNSTCEDTVNIINSRGSLKNVVITNSFADALDVDFSNISIEFLKIENAINDCADFSWGNYVLANSDLSNCGDKALSVGERSQLNGELAIINKSNVGLASKDGSFTSFNILKMKNIKTCVSSYNKKQEFSGSNLFINKLNCDTYLNLQNLDNFSKIKIQQIKATNPLKVNE